jgi:hypothetical protein
MPKEFYTEKDIEDMVKSGVLSLEINDNVALTDLAYEKANHLGVKLVQEKPDNPPAAPVRPYVSQPAPAPKSSPAPPPPAEKVASSPPSTDGDLHQRIRGAVIARLGNQIDSALLDVIIQRVLNSTGVK